MYGSVNEEQERSINMDWDGHQNSPQLSTPDVAWDEFSNDKDSRVFYEGVMYRIDAIRLRVQNTKMLHDYDNYQMSLHDYGYTTYRAGSGAPGFENKMNELKQFFVSRGNKKPPTENPVGE